MSKNYDRQKDISFLEVYDIEKGTTETVEVFDYLIEAPNWTKDGKYLVYNSSGNVYKFNLETKESTKINLKFVTKCNNDHVLSADEKFIAVSHGTKEDGLSRIYIAPFEGGDPVLITPLAPSYLHGWSNDGKTLFYTAKRENGFNIYKISSKGGEEKQLTFGEFLSDGPEVDSKDEYIWYNSCKTGLMQAWKMKIDGSEQTQITFDENWNTWFPHISPDGKTVCTIAYKKSDLEPHEHLPHKNVEIRTMDTNGGNVKTVAKIFGGQGTINVNSWSPCSKKFAYVRYEKSE